MKFSVSKLRSFRTCKKQYFFRYVLKLQKEKGKSNALVFGGAYHSALEHFFKPETWDPTNTIIQEEAKEIFAAQLKAEIDDEFKIDLNGNDVTKEFLELGLGMLDWYFTSRDFSTVTPLAVEVKFEVEVLAGHTLRGIIDLVYEENGKIKVLDHKTAKTNDYVDQDKLFLDEQAASYVLAARLLGFNADVFEYSSHVKNYPKPPKLLKRRYNGLIISTAKNQTTNFELAVNEVMKHDRDNLDNYMEWLAYLKNNPENFLKVERVKHTSKTVNVVLERFSDIIEDIENTKVWYENPGFACTYCPFKSICVQKATCGDPDTVMELEFTREEESEEEWLKS